MSHNRDLSATAAQLGFHSSNIGIGTDNPRYPLEVNSGNLLVSGSAAGNLILEDRGVGDSSRPFALLASNDGNFTITNANRNASGSTTSSVERLRIDSSGNIGIGTDTIQANTNYNTLEIVGDAGTTGGGIVRLKTGDLAAKTMLFCDTGGFEARVETNHPLVVSTNNTERLRITPAGDVGIGDNAPNSNYGINLSVHSTATDGARLKLSDGTSGKGNTDGFDLISTGGVAYMLNRENADMSFSTNNTERMRLYANGKLHLGNSHISSSNLTRLHVGWNTGGTVAGESIIAGTLGNDTTAVSALLTLKNAGNRGSQGASGGSSLAKFEFNNGTAFEIDKYGRRTLQYQPAFNCKLSAPTGSNFTGFFVFNSVSYNIGNHYNSSNGRFTAPVDGRYLFAWYTNMLRAGGNGSLWADWYVNGNARNNRMYTHHSGAWELIGGTIILDLDTNDYVQVYAGTSGRWDGGSYGSYSGYLLG